ncbi:MAG: XRE family transcriptional regulator [Parabacteroides sp.]|jgi:transcriptional regulator with XRE-family HTH domain|uniref:XRE family transcriptional regulator n=1 Tax=Parabacteroides faecalis TaxID=2924040 RepID=A0ABT0BWN8_9BACT|nr:XRE family transcriptional regulator [Parabacteroides faecalis]MBS7343734.1 helix-turn-helix transcriptional regulator [Parabacteroides sp.]MDY5624160.1 XRE family transcriptional regulator [Bacteroidales bacterium]CDE66048.1 transcriptional regulator [Parabacteroides sp. CAG:409]MCI7286535.1 XRE family transcriptional regulator [Parabacteroides sp.]MCI7358178.1 XRE family transcriptional regulator [Parabacteroides sp.]
MDEQIKQIAERLIGLREALELTPEEVAQTCHISVDEYNRIESGSVDISVSVLHQIAKAYGVELTTLMFGDEPKMSSYFVTRKNKGVAVERVKAYKYQSLAAGFAQRKGNPFMVTVHPKPEDEPIYRNSHPGQEFNYVVSGRMMIEINGKQLILEEGDSIYFDSQQPHGMKALDGEKVCFLAVIL